MIENAESLEYFTGDNLWSKNIATGKRFAGINLAFEAAKKEPIGRFNIIGYITETKQFINLNHGRGRGLAETVPA